MLFVSQNKNPILSSHSNNNNNNRERAAGQKSFVIAKKNIYKIPFFSAKKMRGKNSFSYNNNMKERHKEAKARKKYLNKRRIFYSFVILEKKFKK